MRKKSAVFVWEMSQQNIFPGKPKRKFLQLTGIEIMLTYPQCAAC